METLNLGPRQTDHAENSFLEKYHPRGTRPCSTHQSAFIISCSLRHTEVAELYNQGAKEAFESTEIAALPTKEILAEGAAAWFTARDLQATPSFQGSLELWREHRLRGTV